MYMLGDMEKSDRPTRIWVESAHLTVAILDMYQWEEPICGPITVCYNLVSVEPVKRNRLG